MVVAPRNGYLSMVHAELMIYRDAEELAAAAAERISRVAAESIAARGRFTLCLTGGSTPRRTYELLGQQSGSSGSGCAEGNVGPQAEIETFDIWSRSFLFFGDERFVPPEDDRSNYKMVRDSLLQTAPVAPDHVFAIPTRLAHAGTSGRRIRPHAEDVFWRRRRLAGV